MILKFKSLLYMIILLLTTSGYAQKTTDTSGIAIQGIARDSGNTARINVNVTLTFTLYYLDKVDKSTRKILEQVKTLKTDSFGVFSHVINPAKINASIFANQQVYLQIKEGSTIISDALLQTVPYAISAYNGVPTGSIMPFVGEKAPQGWLLCNGAMIQNIPATAKLRSLLASDNTPNLQGMFLRGVGKSTINNQYGPALRETQLDAYKSHTHGSGNLKTDESGKHKHGYHDYAHSDYAPDDSVEGTGDGDEDGNASTWRETNESGAHTHSITGTTSSSGDQETRPVSYGINYIIKL